MKGTRRELGKAAFGSALAGNAAMVKASGISATAGKARPGLHVPSRFIPVPTTISPEAQAAVAMLSPYGILSEPDPSDKAAWESRSRAGSQQFTDMLEESTKAFRPTALKEIALENCVLYEIEPTTINKGANGKVLLFIHGGAFVSGGGLAAAYATYELSMISGLRTYAVDYRMPPTHPFPAGLHDCVEAYRFLIGQVGAENIAVYGISAGGGLLASTLLKARDMGLPMPACCVLHTPEADLTESGDSFETNIGIDPLLRRLTNSIALYADGNDLRDPYLSPLFGDFKKGFPPTLLSAGTRDLFLSNTVLMHRKLKRAGVHAELSVWEAMGHAGFYGIAPEDRELKEEQVAFMLRQLFDSSGVRRA